MILTFVSLEEIREYLVGYQQDFYLVQDGIQDEKASFVNNGK